MSLQPTDNSELAEVRRLLVEREAIKQKLDAIDRAISRAVGLEDEDRPERARLSRTDFRTLCGKPNERISKKKQPSLGRGMV